MYFIISRRIYTVPLVLPEELGIRSGRKTHFSVHNLLHLLKFCGMYMSYPSKQ